VTPLSVRHAQYAALLERVRDLAGLQFPEGRQPDMELVMRRAMLEAGVTSLDEYASLVAQGRVSLAGLVEEVAIGETYFFREPEQFAFLRDVVLPEIIERRGSERLELWSAGCASGEEAYSLAILLEELGIGQGARVLGTDISRRALARACLGRYGSWSLRGAGAARVRPYLRPVAAHSSVATPSSDPPAPRGGETLELLPALRGRVQFAALNLVEPAYPSLANGIHDFDLVLCRNVLIYFDAATVARVARQLYESLAEGGWLIAASSDPSLAELAPFRVVSTERGVFYRKLRARAAAPSRRVFSPSELVTAAAASPAAVVGPFPGLTAAPQVTAVAGLQSVPAVSDRVTRIRALANRGELVAAAEAAEDGIVKEPLDAGGPYLYAAVLLELQRDDEAAGALERAVYLDANFVAAHLALGTVRGRLGDTAGALRSFQTVLRLCAALDPAAILPLADGACAGHVAAVAAEQLGRLSRAGRSGHGG
jgi:chemotaxis protein methyltransferase CheR